MVVYQTYINKAQMRTHEFLILIAQKLRSINRGKKRLVKEKQVILD